MQMAQSTMRSELGKMDLEQLFKERTSVNERIMEAINEVSVPKLYLRDLFPA